MIKMIEWHLHLILNKLNINNGDKISTSRTWSKTYSDCWIWVQFNIQILNVFNIPRMMPYIKYQVIHINSKIIEYNNNRSGLTINLYAIDT